MIDSDDEDSVSPDKPLNRVDLLPKTGTVGAGKTEGDEAIESVAQPEARCHPKSQPAGRPKERPARIVRRRDEEEEIDDADKYVEWIPPEERETIDSRSHLNDKYGY